MRRFEQLDSSIEIVTPENISFRYELAGPFRRLPAFLIDFALRMIVLVGISIGLSILGAAGNFASIGLILILYFLLEWFYGGLFETYWNGQTPGKRIMGIRVLGIQGQPINGLQAIVRNLLRYADLMPMLPLSALTGEMTPFPIPTGIMGLAASMLFGRFQRTGDLVCGTMVVIEDRSWLFGVSKIDDPRAAQLAEYIPRNFEIHRQLSKAVATYVERRKFFSPLRRREIARHLAQPLLERFNLPQDTSYDLMVCALYHRAFLEESREETDILQQVGESPFSDANRAAPSFATHPSLGTAPPAPQPSTATQSVSPSPQPSASVSISPANPTPPQSEA